MKLFSTLCIILFVYNLSNAQYTETINSNRPGLSYSAFGVGNQVIQLEAGMSFGNRNHALRLADANIFGIDYALRYGLNMDRLEVILDGRFLSQTETILVGGQFRDFEAANFERNTIGAKYLLYDPWIKREQEGPVLTSWDANNTFQWFHLIPAVSVYAGANITVGKESRFMPPNMPTFSPRLGIITQHNFRRWAFVSNFIYDRFTTDFPEFVGVFTLTRTISKKYSAFAEYQTYVGDFYSDDLFRFGAAYLVDRNLQVDAFGLINFKDTPQRWQVGLGVSYRIDDFHKEEYIFKTKEQKEEFKKEEEVEEKKSERRVKFQLPPL
jgi:hypothetical protein